MWFALEKLMGNMGPYREKNGKRENIGVIVLNSLGDPLPLGRQFRERGEFPLEEDFIRNTDSADW